MSKEKVDIFIDNTGTALVNMVVGFEEMSNLVNNPTDLPDLLAKENIELLKKKY